MHKETKRSSFPGVTSLNVQDHLQKGMGDLITFSNYQKQIWKKKKKVWIPREESKSGENALSKRFTALPTKKIVGV